MQPLRAWFGRTLSPSKLDVPTLLAPAWLTDTARTARVRQRFIAPCADLVGAPPRGGAPVLSVAGDSIACVRG
jgi:di/tricarboxylate transporter